MQSRLAESLQGVECIALRVHVPKQGSFKGYYKGSLYEGLGFKGPCTQIVYTPPYIGTLGPEYILFVGHMDPLDRVRGAGFKDVGFSG